MLIEKDHPERSVVKQCDLLEVSRSGLYYEPLPESEENLSILRTLDEQYLKTPFYGVERLLPLLVGLRVKQMITLNCFLFVRANRQSSNFEKP